MNLWEKFSLAATMAAVAIGSADAEIPSGYYDSCEGKTGQALLQALYSTISSHTNVGYDGLWTLYQTSDVYPDGSIWDIYTTKHWTYKTEQCGNVSSSIGGCYNREHSLPKSWWGGGKAEQYSDAFHLYPTDGQVNSQRSNWPYGECANGTTKPNNGNVKALGRLGASTFSGYSGTVFEPDDEYKGDLARSYFYMVTCYNDRVASWTQGNGKEMLAGNSYPAFKTWASNLLLKWTRQDEVSQKELDRQEAIYAKQKNRNPFIDHPELVEYIWGDKVGEAWHASTSGSQPSILQPQQGVVIDLGVGAINKPLTKEVTVKTRGIEGSVTLSAYPRTFTVTPSVISAEQANQGTTVTVSLTSASAGTVVGTLSVSADDMECEVDMTSQIYDGIPLYDASGISSEGFTVRWVNVDDAATYTLDVKQGSQSVAGYPKAVNASDESYEVTGLDPQTTYTFQLTSTTISSVVKTVTTAELMPVIDILFDGTLHFDAVPGTPSEVAELLMDIENVSEDIVISVKSPFEVSVDKSTWATSVTLDPEQDRFYLRVNSAAEGSFSTAIVAAAGSYMNDDAEATATITDPSAIVFIETFNVTADYADDYAPYNNSTIQGTAAQWSFKGAGLAKEGAKDGSQTTYGVRVRLSKGGMVSMAEDKPGGIGTVVFEAAKWNNTSDGTAHIEVEYSSDGGATWEAVGSADVSATGFTSFSVDVNRTGNGRIRFRQTSGDRWILDNISISNYTELGSLNELEYHQWDAYSRDGRLIIEIGDNETEVSVYGVDGMTWLSGEVLTPGEHTFDLPKGLFIVVSGDFARRVLVK